MPTASPLVTRSRALASRMIGQEGGLCTLQRVTRGAHNPTEQTRAADVVQTVAVPMVMTPHTPLMGVGVGESLVGVVPLRTGGVSFSIAAPGLPFAPEAGDTITDPNGVVYTVQNVKRIAPGGVAVAFLCAASR